MNDSRNYKIVETLGSGSTAVLYKAIQTSLDRSVVIKRLHPHLTGDPSFTKRFELEAKTAAGLEHDNVVRVFDFGVSGDSYFIVMEYVEGVSLKDLLDRVKPVPVDIALILTAEILNGLEHAHSRNVVHRDIKPGNIMVSKSGRIKITDFGLAKLGASPLYQTSHDSILGTPLYMSPEQAYGESVDHRSDLFSLGIVLLELMTGAQPFLAETYTGVINKILSFQPSDIEAHLGGVPAPIRGIVLRSLEKNPDRRYQNAGEFHEDIELYFGEAGITDRGRRLHDFLKNPSHGVDPGPADDAEVAPERRGSPLKRMIVAGVGIAMASVALTATFAPELLPTLSFLSEGSATARSGSPVRAGLPDRDLHAELLPGSTAVEPAYPTLDETLERARNPKVDVDEALETMRSFMRPVGTLAGSAPVLAPTPPARGAEGSPVTPAATGSAATGRERSARAIGWLTLDIVPSGRVSIDARSYGTVVDLEKIPLHSGSHRLRITHEGFEPYEESVRIATNELTRRAVMLKRETGLLILDASEEASLFVDGRFKGILPLQRPLPLESGPHLLLLRKAGFNEWKANVEIHPGEPLRLRIQLTPIQ